MNIKDLEDKMNNYIISMDEQDNFVLENIEIFYRLNFIQSKLLEKKLKDFDKNINIHKIDKMPFYNIISLINEFYHKLNIKLDINKLYTDGTIGYKFFDYDDEDNYERFRIGANYFNIYDKKKTIISCNNGVVTDADVLIHELSHYRNDMDDGRTVITMLFTETLALTDELIFYDFLLNRNYKIDPNFFKGSFNFLYENSLYIVPIMELLWLYRDSGSLSKESFGDFYNTLEDYDDDLKYFDEMPIDASLINVVSYTIAGYLAPYLFYRYKETNSYAFLDDFNNMIINRNMNIEKCFQKLGLNGFDKEDINILSKSLKKYQKEYLQ